jgi:hypothetical protein
LAKGYEAGSQDPRGNSSQGPDQRMLHGRAIVAGGGFGGLARPRETPDNPDVRTFRKTSTEGAMPKVKMPAIFVILNWISTNQQYRSGKTRR